MPGQTIIEFQRQIDVDAIRKVGGDITHSPFQDDWIGQAAQRLSGLQRVRELDFEDGSVPKHARDCEIG
jgi:hypothetical protein